MRTRIAVVVAALGCTLAAGKAVHAGFDWGDWIPVTISSVTSPTGTTVTTASGALGITRNSADGYQQIGCQVSHQIYSHTTGQLSFYQRLQCWATTTDWRSLYCYYNNDSSGTVAHLEKMINALGTINSDSYLSFSAVGNQCVRVDVTNDSAYMPKRAP